MGKRTKQSVTGHTTFWVSNTFAKEIRGARRGGESIEDVLKRKTGKGRNR